MHKNPGSGTRVAGLRLLVATAVFALPSFAASGRTAEPAARVVAAAPAASGPAVPASATALAFDPAAWDAPGGGIAPALFSLALEAAGKAVARGDAADPGTLTVIDFSKPSTEKRLWVFDVRSHALLFHEYVAHGRGSGENLPTQFSNLPESNRSSLGLFRTGEAYIGKHGYSMRLDGLERGINDRARERAIVVHGADYVNAATAWAQGRLGRSLGCPAVRPEIATPLIKAVKDGGLLFAYYPEHAWLASSSFLN
jgi:hypothetical protein